MTYWIHATNTSLLFIMTASGNCRTIHLQGNKSVFPLSALIVTSNKANAISADLLESNIYPEHKHERIMMYMHGRNNLAGKIVG